MKVSLLSSHTVHEPICSCLHTSDCDFVVCTMDSFSTLATVNVSGHVILLDAGDIYSTASVAARIHTLRRMGVFVPVLVVVGPEVSAVARAQILNAGADDCIAMSCILHELPARLVLLSRREVKPRFFEMEVCVGDVCMHLETHEVTRAGRSVTFTKIEYAILEHLFIRRHTTVAQGDLLASVGTLSQKDGDVLYTHIYNIRKKLEPSDVIRTIQGYGFMAESSAKMS